MEIRLATLNDIEALCPLLSEFFTYNAQLQPVYCRAVVENGEYPKSIIESDDSDFLLAVENHDIIGFIHINQMKTPPYDSIVPHNYAEIMAFMVTASYRERGVGSKLIDFAEQWSKDRKLEYIELNSLADATQANSFYDNRNFITVSHIRRYMI